MKEIYSNLKLGVKFVVLAIMAPQSDISLCITRPCCVKGLRNWQFQSPRVISGVAPKVLVRCGNGTLAVLALGEAVSCNAVTTTWMMHVKLEWRPKSQINQEKDASVNSTNNINIVSPTVNAASIEDNAVDENIVYGCADDPNIPELEEIGRFSDAEMILQELHD
ncbi:hypothetical protein Tco_1172170 [Tanacetum coccineum]